MVEEREVIRKRSVLEDTRERPALGWLINALLLVAVVGLFALSLRATNGQLTIETVGYFLATLLGLMLNVHLVVRLLNPCRGRREASRE